jgi:hypothetical protein
MLSALLFQAMNPLVCDAHASHQECRRQNQEEDVCECCRDEFVHTVPHQQFCVGRLHSGSALDDVIVEMSLSAIAER